MANLQTNLFINNEYVPSSTGTTITVHNPNDDSLVSDKIQSASEADVEAAVAAARAAFPAWKKTPPAQRSKMMLKLADLIEQHADKLAHLESICMGQPVAMAKIVMGMCAATFRYYAGFTDKLPGQTFPESGDGVFKMVNYEPLGVCAGIAAWNGTPLFIGWKIAPAVAVGNTFIFKASEKSPLGAIYMGQLVKEAGFPPGVINFITGGREAGAMLASHMKINKISFTGSAAGGRQVQIAAAKSNLKRVTLELGGKSPSLVFNDANLELAVGHNSQGFLMNSGQVCNAASRIFVQSQIAPKFVEALKGAFIKFTGAMADPSLDTTLFGPLADKAQFDRVMGFLNDAKKDGLEMIVGGARKGETGTFVEPTIVMNPDVNNKIYTNEIFGPVAVVKTFETEEEAIKMANDTTYGLGSIIFTNDLTRALRVTSELEAGTVSINSSHMLFSETPFGGWKESGQGREGGIDGIKAFLEAKTVHINMNVPQ